jgi:hypothetical protein
VGANFFISFKSGGGGKLLENFEWKKKGSFALFVPKFIFLPQKNGVGGKHTLIVPLPRAPLPL